MKKLALSLALIAAMAACKKQETYAPVAVETTTAVQASGPSPVLPREPANTIKAARPPKNHLQNKATADGLSVHFLTNSWALYDNDKRDLRAFAKANRDASDWIVEGYCDERGSIEDNIRLGQRRADGVSRFLRGNGIRGNIESVSYGESNPAVTESNLEAYRFNRRVNAVPSGRMITRGLDLLPADAYLIDATGSMSDLAEGDATKWDVVTSYKFPKGAKLSTFNSCTGVQDVRRISEAWPDCGTPLWHSIADIVDELERGSTLTVLTDGDDSGGQGTADGAIAAAKQYGVKISVVGVGVNDYTKQDLVRLASQTGGGFYIQNNER